SHAKHDAGFYLYRLSVPQVRLEFPLQQSIADALGLLRESTDQMNVLDLAGFVDDDPDRHRVEPMIGKHGINLLNHVLSSGVVLNANRREASACSRYYIRF